MPYPGYLAGPIISNLIVAQVQFPQLVIVPLPEGVRQRDGPCAGTLQLDSQVMAPSVSHRAKLMLVAGSQPVSASSL